MTDGSSNTVAFSESLIGNAGGSTMGRNNSVTNVTGAAGAEVADASSLLVPGNTVLTTALQACSSAYVTAFQASSDFSVANGNRWGWGAMSMTLFNTIVTPNSKQYAWNSCRDACPGCGPDDSIFSNAQSNHPGRRQCLLRGRQRAVRQGWRRCANLDGTRHQKQRRSGQQRLFLSTAPTLQKGPDSPPGRASWTTMRVAPWEHRPPEFVSSSRWSSTRQKFALSDRR